MLAEVCSHANCTFKFSHAIATNEHNIQSCKRSHDVSFVVSSSFRQASAELFLRVMLHNASLLASMKVMGQSITNKVIDATLLLNADLSVSKLVCVC